MPIQSTTRYPRSIGYARVSMARVDEHLGQFRNAEGVLSRQFARLPLARSSRPIRGGRSSVGRAARWRGAGRGILEHDLDGAFAKGLDDLLDSPAMRAMPGGAWPPSNPSSCLWASWANRTPSADVGHPDARNIRAATPGSCETPRAVGDRRARRNPPPEFRGRGLVARP